MDSSYKYLPRVIISSSLSCLICCKGYKLLAIFLVTKLTPISYMKSLNPSLVSIWKSPIMNSGRAGMLLVRCEGLGA